MTAKSKRATIEAPVAKPKARTIPVPPHLGEPHVPTSEMLRQIKVRGDQLSSEIKSLLDRLR